MALATERERKVIRTIVKQALEKWDGKKLTSRIEKEVQERLGDRYEVRYWHDKPFWRKLNIDKKNMRGFREEIVIHHDSQGEKFSFIRFLDGGDHVAASLANIAQYESTLADTAMLDNLEGTLLTFEEQFKNFKKRMEAFKNIKHLLNPEAANFLREFHV